MLIISKTSSVSRHLTFCVKNVFLKTKKNNVYIYIDEAAVRKFACGLYKSASDLDKQRNLAWVTSTRDLTLYGLKGILYQTRKRDVTNMLLNNTSPCSYFPLVRYLQFNEFTEGIFLILSTLISFRIETQMFTKNMPISITEKTLQ
jgi:hypothetical protein